MRSATHLADGHVEIAEHSEIERTVGRAALAGRRIIIMLSELELGGAERQAMVLARHLALVQKAEVEVWGCAGGAPGRVTKLCEEYGIRWRITPAPWGATRSLILRRLTKFAWLVRRHKPDVILSYLIFPNVVCAHVWRLTGAKLCIWNQRDEGIGRMPGVERRAARMTRLFVSNSLGGAAFLIDDLGAAKERVQIIHNGVELAPPLSNRESVRRELGLGEDCFVACMVSNLTELKDHATLLRAWKLVVDALEKEKRRAVLLLAGRLDSADSTHHRMKALAYDLELGRSVRFLGQVLDLASLLSAVDLCAFSSRSEGSPNGVLECMAAGLAVAGTDIPGIREAVSPDGHRFLAPPGDKEALADRILKLALDEKERARLGAANRVRVETEFSPQHMCEQNVALIVNTLEGRPASLSLITPRS